MRKLILINHQAPGDILMLTAALRDLHRCHPDRYLTDVQTSCPELWENNPHRTRLDPNDPEVELIRCKYPLIHRSQHGGVHFINGFSEFLNEHLGLRIRPTLFKGDIHLSAAELAAVSPVEERTGLDLPYWIIVAGGKHDYTIKWWDFRRWQKVVDRFKDRLMFVQVGRSDDYHPPLANVMDLRGRTSLREMVRLTHHAEGVLCPVTFAMHLAAAVPVRPGRPAARPCVVVAGGRESPHWEAYPAHQFIHTVGALSCCDTGGCWRSRTRQLGDGDSKDGADHLCLDVAGRLPRCMDMITPEQVASRIENYIEGRRVRTLSLEECEAVRPFLRGERNPIAAGGARSFREGRGRLSSVAVNST